MNASALDAIEPIAEVVQIHGQDYTVRPLTVGQLPAFVRAITPALPTLDAIFAGLEGDTISTAQIAAALGQSEGVIEAVQIASGVDREWLDDQTLDVLVALVTAVFKVNADFFARALVPAATAAIGRVNGSESGTASSPALSGQATHAGTS